MNDNIFLKDGEITGFIDLERAGIADKWQDIALAIRSIEFNLKILLDELF